MQRLTSQSSNDGNVLLFNLHLSDNPNAKQLEFPSNTELLPDQYSQMLFKSASPLTSFMIDVAKKDYKLNVSENSRGFVLNGD